MCGPRRRPRGFSGQLRRPSRLAALASCRWSWCRSVVRRLALGNGQPRVSEPLSARRRWRISGRYQSLDARWHRSPCRTRRARERDFLRIARLSQRLPVAAGRHLQRLIRRRRSVPWGSKLLASMSFGNDAIIAAATSASGSASGRQSPLTESRGEGLAQLRTCSHANSRNVGSKSVRHARSITACRFSGVRPATFAARMRRKRGSDLECVFDSSAARACWPPARARPK